jgi:demethylmenaquinone methyltransferase/2-methoxy-6-polyprenyl-1,4-benzoquinol methylase
MMNAPDVERVFQSKNQRRAYYDKIARFYDLLAELPEQAIRNAGLSRLAAARGERVLEIGVGTGHCLVELAEAVGPQGRAYGVDISERMVSRTKSRLEEERLAGRAEVVEADAEQLPWASGTIDAVFMSFTLELFDTPEIPRVLGECLRVLRPGGRIVVVGLSQKGHPNLVSRTYGWAHRHFPTLLDCRPIHVCAALEEAGLVVLEATLESAWLPVEIVRAMKPAVVHGQ